MRKDSLGAAQNEAAREFRRPSLHARQYKALARRSKEPRNDAITGNTAGTASVGGMPVNAIDGGDAGKSVGHAQLGVARSSTAEMGRGTRASTATPNATTRGVGKKTDNFGREIAERPNGNVRILAGN